MFRTDTLAMALFALLVNSTVLLSLNVIRGDAATRGTEMTRHFPEWFRALSAGGTN